MSRSIEKKTFTFFLPQQNQQMQIVTGQARKCMLDRENFTRN